MYMERSVCAPCLISLAFRRLPSTRVLLFHRKLSVFLAVLICLLTSSLSIFFLFPRSIAVQPAGLNFSSVVFDKADIHLNITVGGCLCPQL